MPQDTPTTPRTKLFFAAAAAALTVAAGLTAGALLGFVRAPDGAPAGTSEGPTAAAPPVEEAAFPPDPRVAPEPAWAGGERGEGEREGREQRGEGRGREEREEDDDD